MAQPKYDIVVEAVHFKPNGRVEWARVYERRGATFSDCVLLTRDEIIQRLKSNKKVVVGRRIPYLASTFEIFFPIQLITRDGDEILTSSDASNHRDHLEGVPVI